EAVSEHHGALLGASVAVAYEFAEAFGVFDEVGVVEVVDAVEVLPPFGLVLAAVPLEELSQEPLGVVVVAARRFVVRGAVGELTPESRAFGVARHLLLGQFAFGRRTARDFTPALLGFTATCFQPGLEADQRRAVSFVVHRQLI